MPLAAIKLAEGNNIMAVEKIAAVLNKLGPRFAERATAADEQDRFVAENFAELKAHGHDRPHAGCARCAGDCGSRDGSRGR